MEGPTLRSQYPSMTSPMAVLIIFSQKSHIFLYFKHGLIKMTSLFKSCNFFGLAARIRAAPSGISWVKVVIWSFGQNLLAAEHKAISSECVHRLKNCFDSLLGWHVESLLWISWLFWCVKTSPNQCSKKWPIFQSLFNISTTAYQLSNKCIPIDFFHQAPSLEVKKKTFGGIEL